MPQNIVPIVTVINPASPAPGANVTVTVRVNRVPEEPQVVDISGSPQGAFTSLPTQVTVPTTADEVSFGATLSSGATGSVSVTSACNGGSVIGLCHVAADAGTGSN